MRYFSGSIAAMAMVLGGCGEREYAAPPTVPVAYRAPTPTNDQIRAQAKIWADCTITKIVELDDGRSDAGIVALAVVNNCRQFYRGTPNEDRVMTIDSILKLRAQKARNTRTPASAAPRPMIPSSPPPNTAPPAPLIPPSAPST